MNENNTPGPGGAQTGRWCVLGRGGGCSNMTGMEDPDSGLGDGEENMGVPKLQQTLTSIINTSRLEWLVSLVSRI